MRPTTGSRSEPCAATRTLSATWSSPPTGSSLSQAPGMAPCDFGTSPREFWGRAESVWGQIWPPCLCLGAGGDAFSVWKVNPNGEKCRFLEQSLEFERSAAFPHLPLPVITPDTKSADPPGSEDTSCNYDGRGAVGAAPGALPSLLISGEQTAGETGTPGPSRELFCCFFLSDSCLQKNFLASKAF